MSRLKRRREARQAEKQQDIPSSSHTSSFVDLVLTEGGNHVGISGLGTRLQRTTEGALFFSENPKRLFELKSYQWNGPRFTTEERVSVERTGGSSSLKRAVVGGAIGGRRGALLGAATARRGRATERTTHHQIEEPALAVMVLQELTSSQPVTIRFMCLSTVHQQLQNWQPVSLPHAAQSATEKLPPAIVENSPSVVEEIRQFKGLLDDGIISQAEFEQKKKQLLNL